MLRIILTLSVFALTSCTDGSGSRELEPVTTASGAALTITELDNALIRAAERANIIGMSFALINNGKIVHARSYGIEDIQTGSGVSDRTIFEFASMSKPAFGALVVDLASDGIVDLDKPLAEYLPLAGIDDPRASRLTARQVLTHQTGLPNWRRDNDNGKLDIAFEPGTSRRYSGEGYEYLADVLMQILGTDDRGLDEEFYRRIALPAGASDTRFVQSDERFRRKAAGHENGETYVGAPDYRDGKFGAAHSLHSTASDYARLMIGLMAGPSLDEEEQALFFAPQNVVIPADVPEAALGLVDQALGFAVYDLPPGRFYVHGGNNEGFTGLALLDPENRWGFVVVTNENQANSFNLEVVNSVLGSDLSLPN